MTVPQRDYIKKHWITFANLVLLVGIVVNQAKWQQSVDDDLARFNKHIENQEIHQNYEDKVKMFIPRTEMEIHLQNLYDILNEIKTDVKKNNRK